MVAASKGHTKSVIFLLFHHAKVNVKNKVSVSDL